VSGGSGVFTFVWGDGPTTEDRTGLFAGSYTVTITNPTDTAVPSDARYDGVSLLDDLPAEMEWVPGSGRLYIDNWPVPAEDLPRVQASARSVRFGPFVLMAQQTRRARSSRDEFLRLWKRFDHMRTRRPLKRALKSCVDCPPTKTG